VDIENTVRVTSYVLGVEVEEQMGLDVMLIFSR
jgi:hypothetical protein